MGRKSREGAAPAKKVTAQELFRPGLVLVCDKISMIGDIQDRTSRGKRRVT